MAGLLSDGHPPHLLDEDGRYLQVLLGVIVPFERPRLHLAYLLSDPLVTRAASICLEAQGEALEAKHPFRLYYNGRS